MRVLLIDDDPVVRQIARIMLESGGHEVEEAPDAEAGLRAAHARQPDVVLCDMLMDGVGGLGVLAELRRDGGRTPFVAMSGGGSLGGEEVLPLALSCGADAVLPKPFKIAEILSVVTRAARPGG